MYTATSADETQPFWDKLAPKYAKKPIGDPDAYEQKLDRVRALVRPSDRMLEVGCGTGSTALRLAPSVAEMTATDISRAMIEIAEEKRQTAGVANVHFVRAGARAALSGAPYDVISAFSLLHLVDDLPGVLASLHSQLKPGGLFISKTVCLGEAPGALRLLVRALRVVGIAPPVAFLSRADVSQAIEAAGFDVLETRDFGKGKLNPFIVAQRPA